VKRASYTPYFVAATAVILIVFFEPTARRLAGGHWQRGKYVYQDSLSLDVHAVIGFTFVAAFVIQIILGRRQRAHDSARRLHEKLGKLLIILVVPLFVGTAAWVVADRSTSIAPELSVIFKVDREMGRVVLGELLVFTSFFFVRAWLAIRDGDVARHVDAVLGAFLMASAIATIRFLYSAIWATGAGSPFSVIGMYFITVAIVVGAMALAYARAGRFAANRRVLAGLVAVTVATGLLCMPLYDFMDTTS